MFSLYLCYNCPEEIQVWTPLAAATSEEALLNRSLIPGWYAINQTLHQWNEGFTQHISLLNCSVCSPRPLTDSKVCVAACTGLLSINFVIICLQFREVLRQAFHGKWWFPPSAPFQPCTVEECGCARSSCHVSIYHSWEGCLWPRHGETSAHLSGLCHTLFWSSLDGPCTAAAMHYLFI